MIINGVKVLVVVVATGQAVLELWDIWQQREASPFGWPGNDGTVPPVEGWEWRPTDSQPGVDNGAWVNPETGESLSPDLEHNEPIEPHWD